MLIICILRIAVIFTIFFPLNVLGIHQPENMKEVAFINNIQQALYSPLHCSQISAPPSTGISLSSSGSLLGVPSWYPRVAQFFWPCLKASLVAQRLKHLPVMQEIPGSGRSPGEGNGNPLQYSCLENPMDGGAYSPWGRKELDTTERLHFHFHFLGGLGGRQLSASYLEEAGFHGLCCWYPHW